MHKSLANNPTGQLLAIPQLCSPWLVDECV
jgi:hypothetical protein